MLSLVFYQYCYYYYHYFFFHTPFLSYPVFFSSKLGLGPLSISLWMDLLDTESRAWDNKFENGQIARSSSS